jgi:hypothetical protein
MSDLKSFGINRLSLPVVVVELSQGIQSTSYHNSLEGSSGFQSEYIRLQCEDRENHEDPAEDLLFANTQT